MKPKLSALVRTPRAAATSGSRLSNASGRQITSSRPRTTRRMTMSSAELREVDRDDLAGEQSELVAAAAGIQGEEQDAEPKAERHEHRR